MKTVKLTLLLALLAINGLAQGNYEQTMSTSIAQIYQAKEATEFDQLTNKFSRIAQVEAGKWEPRYYEALTHVFKSFRVENPAEKDEILDRAHGALNLATEISPNNSEIIALQGFVDMMKVSVDPATRGQTLTPKVMESFGKAMALDPENPRATLFMAQMQIGTAQFFGTPISEPCALVSRAEYLFENHNAISPLAPQWGQNMIGQYKGMCNSVEN